MNKRIVSKNADLLPITTYDPAGFYVLKDGSNLDLLQVHTRDLVSASDDELEYDMMKLEKLFRVYCDDLKIIAMNFPCQTSVQQQYFRKRIEKAKNEVFKRFLQEQLDELEYLAKFSTTREFYLMFFSKDGEQHDKNMALIINTLSADRDGLVLEMTEEKKHRILFKLSNQNAGLF